MNNYGEIKRRLNRANQLVAEGKIIEADVEVQACRPLGATLHDLAYGLTDDAMHKLRDYAKEQA